MEIKQEVYGLKGGTKCFEAGEKSHDKEKGEKKEEEDNDTD